MKIILSLIILLSLAFVSNILGITAWFVGIFFYWTTPAQIALGAALLICVVICVFHSYYLLSEHSDDTASDKIYALSEITLRQYLIAAFRPTIPQISIIKHLKSVIFTYEKDDEN